MSEWPPAGPDADVRLPVDQDRHNFDDAQRPEWAARVLAAVAAAERDGGDHLDDVDRNLLLAVEARVRYSLGERGPDAAGPEHWRDLAVAAAHRALDKLGLEPPTGARVVRFPGPEHRRKSTHG